MAADTCADSKKKETEQQLTVVSVCAGLVEVGHGVVGVVLVLPPPHAEALHEVTPEDTGEVAVRAVLEHLRFVSSNRSVPTPSAGHGTHGKN